MQQIVLPIKDSNVLNDVQDTLLNNFKAHCGDDDCPVRLKECHSSCRSGDRNT